MKPLWVAALLLCLIAAVAGPLHAADYFGHPDSPPAATAPPSPDTAVPLESKIRLPGPLARMLGLTMRLQGELNARLRAELMQARTGGSWLPGLTIIAASFLYGLIHAIGPGHGKVVVSSYFLTRKARVAQGVAMSAAGAFVQAASATALVGIPALLLQVSARQIMDQASILEMISYGFIALLGLWMTWNSLTGRDHSHEHHHGHHEHGEQAHAEAPHAAGTPNPGTLGQAMMAGAAIGLRPCSGAILVLLFTLANGMFLTGIVATFAMGFGVSLTVALVSLGSLGIRHAFAGISEHRPAAVRRLGRIVSLAGTVLITLFGILELAGIYFGVLTPLAG